MAKEEAPSYFDGSMVPGVCSVVIPVFGRTDELHEAIESVLEQTYRNIEIIVVDDGSTPPLDPVRDKKACAEHGIPLRWIALQNNHGPSNARNKGLEAAHGEFVTFLDSDDAMLRGKLEEQIHILRENPNVAGVMCGYVTSGDSENSNGKDHVHLPDGDMALERLLSFDRSLSVTGSSSLYRTVSVREVGGYDQLLHAVEDFDLLLRIVANGGVITPLRKALLRVDVSPKRTHLSEDLIKQEIGRVRFLAKHDALLARAPKARIENLLLLGIVRFRLGKRHQSIWDLMQVVRSRPLKLKAWTYLICCAVPSLYPLVVRVAKAAHERS